MNSVPAHSLRQGDVIQIPNGLLVAVIEDPVESDLGREFVQVLTEDGFVALGVNEPVPTYRA